MSPLLRYIHSGCIPQEWLLASKGKWVKMERDDIFALISVNFQNGFVTKICAAVHQLDCESCLSKVVAGNVKYFAKFFLILFLNVIDVQTQTESLISQ